MRNEDWLSTQCFRVEETKQIIFSDSILWIMKLKFPEKLTCLVCRWACVLVGSVYTCCSSLIFLSTFISHSKVSCWNNKLYSCRQWWPQNSRAKIALHISRSQFLAHCPCIYPTTALSWVNWNTLCFSNRNPILLTWVQSHSEIRTLRGTWKMLWTLRELRLEIHWKRIYGKLGRISHRVFIQSGNS